MSKTILVTQHDRWIEICLNRPDRLNSFNEEMHEALAEHMAVAADSASIRAVLLTGAGRGFCAGQDLNDRDPAKMDSAPDLGDTLTRRYNPLIEKIKTMPKPVVCAVNGVAAGAGANIALACDVVFAVESARFIQSFGKVGLIPDAGGSWHLTRLLGGARARALAFTAEPLSAAKAESWGLIWKVLPESQFMGEARLFTEGLANGPTLGLANTKKAIMAAESNTLQQQLKLEAELQFECGQSKDYAEGVSAFLNKREPLFSGN